MYCPSTNILKEHQCVHCALAHRKAKLANHSNKRRFPKMDSSISNVFQGTESESTGRFDSLLFKSSRQYQQRARTSNSSPFPKLSSFSLVLNIAFVILMLSLLDTAAAVAYETPSVIPVRVSPIITTLPRNFSDVFTSSKIPCNIGLLAPAVFHNSSTVTTAYDSLTTYRKQGVHWYSRDIADIVKEAIDEAVRVLLKDSQSKKKGGEGRLKQGEGHGLQCSVKVEWRDGGWCDEKSALGQAVGLHMVENIRAFVGPTCHNSLRVVALLASFWSTPVITWEPVQRAVVGDKSYDNVFSVYGAFEDFAQSAAAVIRHLKWKKIAFVYEESPLCEKLMEQLSLDMLDLNLASEVYKVTLLQGNTTDLGLHLNTIKALTRTIVTCSRQSVLMKILSEAEKAGMTDGYYAFLHLDFNVRPMTSSGHSDGRRSLLDVVLQLGQFHGNLEREEENRDEDGNEAGWTNGTRSAGEIQVTRDDIIAALDSQHALAAYIHDAVVVATVATQAGVDNFSPESLSIGPPFQLKTGNIEFDDQGIRRATFSLVQHLKSGELTTVAEISTNQSATFWKKIVWPGGYVPVSDITCRGDDTCIDVPGIIAGVTLGVFALCLLFALMGYFYRKHRRRQAAAKKDWLVDDREVKRRRAKLPMGNGFTTGPGSNMETVKRLVRMETRGTLGLGSNCSLDKNMLYAPIGNYKDMVVAVKHVRWTEVQMGKREMLEDLTTAKELSHDNVNQFVGAHVSSEPGSSYVLFRYCSKGSLQDVLANDDIKLDWMFKLSFALDLARGLEYIHKTALRSHGNLKSSNCVIDSRWVLKVTDYGAITSYRKPGSEDDLDNKVYYSSLLWTAPELLRVSKRPHKGTQKGDVYSVGIILQEILFRCAPYFFNYMEAEDIITLVKNQNSHRPYRPVVPPDNELPARAINLMVACWSEAPDSRPDIHQIRKRVRDLNGSKRFNIMDNMLLMLESYSSNLEQLVTDRTEELEAEKRKTDSLLYQMLPPLVAEQLKSGMSVTPESYDKVSIFFSDIVGFTAIASHSKPLEVVDLLNDLYTCFDEVIARRDVYKVETIGDAYMCVSGCPRRNGNRHAGEIANMALDLISAVTHFRIRHKPEEQLNLRVGLHTGACAAGVVGRTMPRYCLFGDTVNMASRMESTGKALHIHMSSQMKDSLDELDWGFLTIERGFIEVKGKGLQKTFWLAGKKNYKKPLPESLFLLQKRLEDGELPPTPSYTTLTVGDSMFSALRKTSITVSNITVKNSPYTSDTEEMGGDYGVGGVNTTTSQYGNLLHATVNQHYGRRKSSERKIATHVQCAGTEDNIVLNMSSVESLGGIEPPKTSSKANNNHGSLSISGEEKYLGSGPKSVDSFDCHENLSDAVKRNLSKPRKSLGEIGGAWKTVESADSDSGVPCSNEMDASTALTRHPSAHSNDRDHSMESEKGSDDENTGIRKVLKVKSDKKFDHTSLLGGVKGFIERRKEKRSKIKHQSSSDSIETTPSGMKRKRAVVSPPKLVLVQSDLSESTGGKGFEDSHWNRLYQKNWKGSNGRERGNESGSDHSQGPRVKSPVKKDSACYSMADSVGDAVDVPNKQCEDGNVRPSNTFGNSQSTDDVADSGSNTQSPPILHVTSSSPINSPTEQVNHDPKSRPTLSIDRDNQNPPSFSNNPTPSTFTYSDLLSQDFGHLGTTSASSTKTADLFDPPTSLVERKFTPINFDTGGSEIKKVTTSSYSLQEQFGSSAPIITVQQENGRRTITSVPPHLLSNSMKSVVSPKSTNREILANSTTPPEWDIPFPSNKETSDAVATNQGSSGSSSWSEDSPVTERDHSWFPQSNGKDFLVYNHYNTHPALVPVHNEDCPASSQISKTSSTPFTAADNTHRQSPEGRSSDVSENVSEVQPPDPSDKDYQGPKKASKSNGDVIVRASRRKQKLRRIKSHGVPEDLPRIEIT